MNETRDLITEQEWDELHSLRDEVHRLRQESVDLAVALQGVLIENASLTAELARVKGISLREGTQ